MVYSQGMNDTSLADEKLVMRGTEVTLFSPIDHRFDGKGSIAAHEEGGKTAFELHELLIESSKTIPRSQLKIGQFFFGSWTAQSSSPTRLALY